MNIRGYLEGYLTKQAAEYDQMKGGLADNTEPTDYDPEELAEGVEEELEHTDDVMQSLEIAMDHLKEHPKYYSFLEKMEEDMEAGKPAPEESEEDSIEEKDETSVTA
jgi:thiamine pyrophosphate-dependent acetolactate synthase large subunit-like protein